MKKTKISKLLALVLTGAMLLAGCSSDSGKESATTANDEQLNIVILLNGTLGDKAFYDSAANGGTMIEDELKAKVKVVEMTYDETKWMPTLVDFSEDKDTDIIIVGTWQMVEKLQEIAPQYPDKKYIIFDSAVDYSVGGLDNVYSIEYKQNECSFLAGAVAASATKSGTVGFIGGMENNVINDFLVGYIQGAKHIKEDVKMLIGYVGNFNDSAKAKELTIAQINQNADIIYQVASTAGLGVIDAVTEKNKLAIGVDSDQAEAFMVTDKTKADHILTSALKRVDLSLLRAIKLAKDDKLPWGEKELLGIEEGCVGIAKNETFKTNVPEDVLKKVDELEKAILDGSIKVDTAFGKSTEEIQAIKDSVR
ncbi:MAG: BMP family lipoprotein [Filifactoraceae bacterium]